MINQEFTSKNTSINSSKLPRLFSIGHNLMLFKKSSTNLDLGGGRFNNVHDFLFNKYGTTNLIYDPYNRSRTHNRKVLDLTSKGTHSVTLSNVLNVIKEEQYKLELLKLAKERILPNGVCLISVYEGDRSSIGRQTRVDQWQENKKLSEYLSLVLYCFKSATVKQGIIIATN